MSLLPGILLFIVVGLFIIEMLVHFVVWVIRAVKGIGAIAILGSIYLAVSWLDPFALVGL